MIAKQRYYKDFLQQKITNENTGFYTCPYFIAYYPKASEFNEHHSTVIETPEGKSVLVKQIAGIIARRIVCYANIGKETVQGEDLGFIKFGSRVDLFLPLGTSIAIEKGEKVKGNNTIVAFLDMKD